MIMPMIIELPPLSTLQTSKGKKPLMRFSQRNYVKNTFRNPAVSNLSWGLFFLGDLEISIAFSKREAIILKSGSKHLLLIKCGR